MNNFNFGEVLTRAWQNIWKHKVLWIFGILASCARRSGGSSGRGGNSSYQTGSGDAPFSGGQLEQFFEQIGQYIEHNLWVIAAFVIVIFLLSFISFALGMMGRIGLIKGTYKAENGAESLAFGEIWAESTPYFGRIFGMNFLIGLAFFVVILIPLTMLVAALIAGSMAGRDGIAGIAGIGFVCLLPIFCLLIPIGWIVSVIVEQAQAAIVLEELSMWDGFKRGWEIVKSNILPLIIISLILGVGGGILGVIIALPIIIAVVPLIIGAGSLRESLTPVYISLACCAVYLPVIIFFNGVLTAYIQSVWALTYMRLAKPKKDAPIFIEANA